MAELSASRIATLTLLLADVEGSVRHWEADKASAAAALRRLSEIASEAADRHEGVRPVEQGEGDSFVIAFSRPSQALACALEIQLATLKEPWPGGRELRARMALHSGEVEIRDDGRYAGHAFNRSARLRALAHGGQTLVTRATHDLVVDALPEGAFLKDLGEHRLRDLARPERVYQLCHPDLPDQFPALRSLSALPNNLPQQLTSFIGRSAEMAQVRSLLDGARLITLTGAGGCGKTRLALHVAADLLEGFPDGVWWVDLAPVADAAIVPQAVASPMSIREVVGEALTETLVRALGEQRVLLILDNCEHLVDACSAVASALLQRCPNVSIIATSREPLGVEGETAFRVPSLPVPDRDAIVEPEALDSMRLFLDRARAVRPNLKTTQNDAERISEICRRLDGIPLAIELAAARIRMLSPAQIADGLTDRFHLLTGGTRTALPRQRTLEASVDWSYRLLSDPERVVLGRLSVFAGSFELDAAEEVCSGDGIDRYAVLDLLSALVDRSLVQVEEEEPRIRYRLLETIRAYARQRLADSDDAAAARTRHLDHYVAVAAQAETGLLGAAFPVWVRRLDVELDNVRAASDWALGTGQADKALRLLGRLWMYCWMRGRTGDIERRLHSALEMPWTDSIARANALTAAEALAFYAGEFGAARTMGAEAIALHRDNGQPGRALQAMVWVTWAHLWMDAGTAAEPLAEAVALADQIGKPGLKANFLYGLGFQEVLTGDARRGIARIEEAIEVARSAGDVRMTNHATVFRGISLIMLGRLAEARSTLQEQLDQARALQDAMFTHNGLFGLALADLTAGAYERASDVIEEVRRFADVSGHRVGNANASWLEAWLALGRGDLDVSSSAAERTLAIAEPMEITFPMAMGSWLLGSTALVRGRPEEAIRHFESAIAVQEASGETYVRGRALVGLARATMMRGDDGRAEDLAHEALQLLAAAHDAVGVFGALELLAEVTARRESHVEAVRLAAAGDAGRITCGAGRFPFEQESFDALLASCRGALGDPVLETARAEGAAMSMEEAVAYAARGRGERKRPSAGWDSLTPTELDVVRLAAQGLSNPEIAQKLFIARNTVKVHLSHVFAKLGVTSRAELAAEATRRGI